MRRYRNVRMCREHENPPTPIIVNVSDSNASQTDSVVATLEVRANDANAAPTDFGTTGTGVSVSDANAGQTDSVIATVEVDVSDANADQTDVATIVASFDPLIGPAGSVPIWSYDADHCTVLAGNVQQITNRGSLGTPTGDGVPYQTAGGVPFIASSPAFGGQAAFDGGAAFNSRVGVSGTITNSGARSWIFVLDANSTTFGVYPGLMVNGDYSNTILYGRNTPGNIELGQVGTAQISAPMPNNTPTVLIITLAADGSAKIYISSLTAAASVGPGTVNVPAAGGFSMNVMGQGLFSLNPIGGPWRWFQYFDVDLTATGEVAYFMNGFGADSSIPIAP